MRVTCCKCGCRFDVPNREVLAAAARLGHRRDREPVPDVEAAGPEVNGNVLRPEDEEGRRLREVAIARRMRR